MIARRPVIAALAMLFLPVGPATAQEDDPSLEIVDGYVRATAPGAMAAAAYATIRSLGPADRLIGVTTPVAARSMIHENIEKDGVMQMRPVDGLDIPAGGTAVLEPGGMHLMLMGLTAPLNVGEEVEIQLEFERAGTVSVVMPIKPLQAD